MKKINLLIIFISMLFFAYGNNNDSSDIQQQINFIKKEDSINKVATQNIKDSLIKVNDDIVYLKGKDRSFDWKNAIPWVLSIAAFLISYLTYARESSFKNLAFLIDSNKMKIADPALWSFYDTHAARYKSKIEFSNCNGFEIDGEEEFDIEYNGCIDVNPYSGSVIIKQDEQEPITGTKKRSLNLSGLHHFKITGKAQISINPAAKVNIKSREDIRLHDKLLAYSYYKLNSFELVFKYSKGNRLQGEIWENYMIDLILRSSCFRKVVEEESKGYLYNDDYRKKLQGFLVLIKYINKMTEEKDKERIIKLKERILNAYDNGEITAETGIEELRNRFF